MFLAFHMDAEAYLSNPHATASHAWVTLLLVFECMSQQSRQRLVAFQ